MIRSMTVINPQGEPLKLTLGKPETSEGMAVVDIQGLGPVKATINTSSLAGRDGVLFNTARVGARNVVVTLAFVGIDIETIRQKTYQYFPTKSEIKLIVETDNLLVETYGYVEHNDPSIFNSAEWTQISILCDDPYFQSSGEDGLTVTPFFTTTKHFQFPFKNDSLTEKLLTLGEIDVENTKSIFYRGTEDVGMTIALTFSGPVTGLKVANTTTNQSLTIDPAKIQSLTGNPLGQGDILIVDTHVGRKTLTLYRDGTAHNVINALGLSPQWIKLTTGPNELVVTTASGGDNLLTQIENRTLHEGI